MNDATELMNLMLEECKISDRRDYDIDSASEEYLRHFDEYSLINLIHDNFHCRTITDAQKIIIGQPWYRIYTTNYDNVIEICCNNIGKKYTNKVISEKVEPPSLEVTQIVHVYGHVTSLSPEAFKSQFLLTESQRDASPFLRGGHWFNRFNDDILSADNVYFIGFSLRDVDIRRLLGSLPPLCFKKIFFIESDNMTGPVQNRLARFGNISKIGTDGFAKLLGQIQLKRSYDGSIECPSDLKELRFDVKDKAEISAVDIDRLLVGGLLKADKLSRNDIDGGVGSYTIARAKEKLSRACNFSDTAPVVIHSSVGNGKTIFIWQIAFAHALGGFRIFELLGEPEDVSNIISFINNSTDNYLIIAEDISRYNRIISQILDLSKKNIRLITSARSSLFETSRHVIDERLGKRRFVEIDLNLVSNSEIINIVKYLEVNGLLGSKAELTSDGKKKFIENECKGQMRDVVLSLYEGGALHDRVENYLNGLRNIPKDIFDLTVLGALLTVAGFSRFSKLHVATELSNFSGSYERIRDAYAVGNLQDIIRIEAGEILFGSPALAQFVLSNSVGIETTLDVAKRALRYISDYLYDDTDFDALTRGLLKFSVYSKIFGNNRYIENHMDKFYDECRELKVATKDPLFLVQRSIANMTGKRFDIASKFVETAYGMAKRRPNYNTYQIETHEAKLLLSISLEFGFSDNLSREKRAMSLLTSVLRRRNDDLYHPLSTMRLFAEISNKWGGGAARDQRVAFRSILMDAVGVLASVPSHIKQRFSNLRYVEATLNRAAKQ
ncbi:SIR2 family protein [Ancylobacter sp. SL191]|uniref:SIR2 family protein n=1 Tax=Ancylobacter sp. SL191 TaxID=2995166 RepID=UPI00226DF04B|nr:SIR2 family protein [Ancylobacter sp. SL191]WAC28323.1 SIR2 family protein [Ancylobacter sp. SL191]